MDLMEGSPRPNIASLFGGSSNSIRNPKFRRAAAALQWRQKYLGSDIYGLTIGDGGESPHKSEGREDSDVSSGGPWTLELHQVKNGEESGVGTGCSVWPAAHVLTKYLERRYRSPGGMRGLRLCDIGSGSGCVGLGAACLGADVTLTDLPCVFPLLGQNMAENVVRCGISPERVRMAEYDWGHDTSHLNPPFDVVIVSDCILPKLYPIEPLVQAVAAVMGPSSVALFSYEHRVFPHFDPRQEFRRLADAYGLQVVSIPISEHDATYCADDIEIWEVRRRPEASNTTADKANDDSNISKGIKQEPLKIMSWGSVPEVEVRLGRHTVRLHQEQGVGGMIGCNLWISSVYISKYLLNQHAALVDTTPKSPRPVALDLGAGCGLTSIALAMCGYDVIAADKAVVVPLLQRNADACLSAYAGTGSIEVISMDWSASDAMETLSRHLSRPIDLVVCSDCVYQLASVDPLLNILEQLNQFTPGVRILVANEMRSSFDEICTRLAFERWALQDIYIDISDAFDIEVKSSEVGFLDRPVRTLICTKMTV